MASDPQQINISIAYLNEYWRQYCERPAGSGNSGVYAEFDLEPGMLVRQIETTFSANGVNPPPVHEERWEVPDRRCRRPDPSDCLVLLSRPPLFPADGSTRSSGAITDANVPPSSTCELIWDDIRGFKYNASSPPNDAACGPVLLRAALGSSLVPTDATVIVRRNRPDAEELLLFKTYESAQTQAPSRSISPRVALRSRTIAVDIRVDTVLTRPSTYLPIYTSIREAERRMGHEITTVRRPYRHIAHWLRTLNPSCPHLPADERDVACEAPSPSRAICDGRLVLHDGYIDLLFLNATAPASRAACPAGSICLPAVIKDALLVAHGDRLVARVDPPSTPGSGP